MIKSPVARLAAAILAVVLLAALGINLAEERRNATFPADSPQGVVQRYLKAIAADERVEAFAYVAGDSPCTQRDMDAAFGAPIDRTIVQSARIEGDQATVLIRLEYGYASPYGGRATSDLTYSLVRESGQWRLTGRIWPMERCPGA